MAKVSAYSKATWTFIVILVMQICFGAGGIEVQTRRIPEAEMDALREIAEQVGKNDWDFSLNHCDENLNWHTAVVDGTYNSTVNCTCPSDEECHIMAIYLKGQDLSGVLPRSLAKLPYLKTIDFTRNYLGGPIPAEWASMKLEYMSLIVNRLSGTIPGYLGRITSLTYLNLESNMFDGTVPAELGNLVNLVYLNLNSNNLTGNLPKELNNLIKLTTLKFGSNNFTGKLPSFQSWKQLQRLELEASGFEGPIPSSISLLHNLTGLRISDLNGGASKFPQLGEMKNMTRLVLRNCHISDSIPENLVNLPLTEMDLTYNKLQGNIPNLERVETLTHMFLTRNLLNGSIPLWIMQRNNAFEIDLSYNNFSDSINEPPTCSYSLNLFRSFFSVDNSDQCLQYPPCPEKDRYSLHINCGGDEAIVGNIKFEADQDKGGSAKFKQVKPYWGFSSSGYFLSNHKTWDDYTTKNVSILTMNYSLLYKRDLRMSSSQLYTKALRINHSQAYAMNFSQLYTSARISPLSFTYYGHCLANGNYTVTLHFAEIIFRDNQSFQSLGRRIFDVYIQDELVWKDFDIRTVAQGVDKAVLLQFDDIVVENKTIEIRFYWAGKGTTLTPTEGTYGPLISAISIESKFKPHSNQSKKIFAAVGAAAFAVTILFIFWWKCFRGRNSSMEQGKKKFKNLKDAF